MKFQVDRGLEVESVYAGAILLAAATGLTAADLTYDETSWHVRTAWSGRVRNATFILQLAALAAVCWRYYRSGASDLVRWSAAGVVAFVVASNILSPQFMLWILPLIALIGGRLGMLARRIFLPCCAATSLVFPWCFLDLVHRAPFAVVLVNLRNALLLGLFLLLLLYPSNEPVSPAATPGVTPEEAK
jgi:hypothetical protein